MAPDDAAMLERFDEVLDDVVEDRRADMSGVDAELIEIFGRLQSATRSVSPHSEFALGLRRSLMQRAPSAPVATNAAARVRLTSSPAARWIPSSHWRPPI